MVTQPKPYYTAEEYLALERAAEYKSEYLSGEIYAMTGASRAHNLITLNIGAVLHDQLEGRPCEAYLGDMRVQVAPTGMYTYPDAVAVCEPVQMADGHNDTLLNPTIIVEVLSPSTEAYDRGDKFAHYWRLESLADYLLVAQDRVRVEHFVRHGNGWLLTEATDLGATIRLESIGCKLPLAEVYAKVKFPVRAIAEPELLTDLSE